MIIRLLKWLSFAALLLVFSVVGYVLFIQLSFDSTKPIVNYGSVDTELFTDESQTRPLLVYFGGSEGGNSMTKPSNVSERNLYLDAGYAVLAVGYFKMPGLPEELDRISLDAIYEKVIEAQQLPFIDSQCVAVMGGSKGAELALLLASLYPDIDGAVAFAGSHVSFASPSFRTGASTASFQHNGRDIPFVQIPNGAIPKMLTGNFREAHNIALEQGAQEAANAAIRVENIKGAVLLVSGENDHVWPSAEMSDRVIKRLEENKFAYPYEHIVAPGGNHFTPQNDYHDRAIAFLNRHFKTTCQSETNEKKA